MGTSKVTHLVTRDITPRAVIADLRNIEDDIDEIYLVIKTKDGRWAPSLSGDLEGFAFAILLLQQYWNQHE